jgi:sarcosine oxidase gamma subunit
VERNYESYTLVMLPDLDVAVELWRLWRGSRQDATLQRFLPDVAKTAMAYYQWLISNVGPEEWLIKSAVELPVDKLKPFKLTGLSAKHQFFVGFEKASDAVWFKTRFL